MTLAFSRDDAEGKFLTFYLRNDVLKTNPFEKLDQRGVGQLMDMAATKARAVKPEIKLGICGEHGGEPSSVKFCHRIGLNYVSWQPVPGAARPAGRGTGRAGGIGFEGSGRLRAPRPPAA